MPVSYFSKTKKNNAALSYDVYGEFNAPRASNVWTVLSDPPPILKFL